MSARTILNPPLNTTLNNISDTAVSGGVITFSPAPSMVANGFTTATFDIPYIVPSGSTTGLAFVFTMFPTAGDPIPLYSYTINSYSSTDGVNITLTFVNSSSSQDTSITGVSWVAYSGSLTPINL